MDWRDGELVVQRLETWAVCCACAGIIGEGSWLFKYWKGGEVVVQEFDRERVGCTGIGDGDLIVQELERWGVSWAGIGGVTSWLYMDYRSGELAVQDRRGGELYLGDWRCGQFIVQTLKRWGVGCTVWRSDFNNSISRVL